MKPNKLRALIGVKQQVLLALCLTAIAGLTVTHFPWAHDQVGNTMQMAERREYRSFYNDTYADLGRAPTAGTNEADLERSVPSSSAQNQDSDAKRIQAFVKRYDLEKKRVLEVGSGRGKLQDVVDEYVGLDISSSAERFYHKPFVCASATDIPFEADTFDAVWTINVLEHVPKPEHALLEMRRVLKDGGLIYLSPAWQCRDWHADGYDVRPYSDLPLGGKIVKASIPIRNSVLFRAVYTGPIRLLRFVWYLTRREPTVFRYRAIEPNYKVFWEEDGDAVNSMDPYEAILWFKSRGDSILNYDSNLSQLLVRTNELIIRVNKTGTPR